MDHQPCNCIICAQEFDPTDLHNITLYSINITKFKVCQACFDKCDPVDDYRQAKEIINVYLKNTLSYNYDSNLEVHEKL